MTTARRFGRRCGRRRSKAKPVQNDLFNVTSGGHPMREFMGFNTMVALTYKDIAYQQMVAMMDAITDQGEGSELKKKAGAAPGGEAAILPGQGRARIRLSEL